MESETPTAEIESIKEIQTVEEKKEYVLTKTIRLILNVLTHILMMITVFVCLVYACKSSVGFFELHIILCVVGYQFFMCQGALALGKYNAWSVYLRRLHRIHVHWVLQLIAVALVSAGSVLYMLELPEHVTSPHGGVGIVALAASLLASVCGLVTGVSYLAPACASARRWLKYIHHAIAVTALLLSAVSLCLAFINPDFKLWMSKWFDNEDISVPILMLVTILFTVSIAIEYLLVVIWI